MQHRGPLAGEADNIYSIETLPVLTDAVEKVFLHW
jgi:hypothetical protein